MKRYHIKTTRLIECESYVTLRRDWPQSMQDMVSERYQARGHKVLDGRMEWMFFKDEESAGKWCKTLHREEDIRRDEDAG